MRATVTITTRFVVGLSFLFLSSFSTIAAESKKEIPGMSAGKFKVSNSGGATYSIDLIVPPAALAPKLSLAYDSQDGNGLLGMAELDTFVRVFSYGQVPSPGSGPLYFVVKNKAGETIEFGGNDSNDQGRIEAQGKTSVRIWALSKITDASGNFLTVSYEEDNANGDYRPLEIMYTGNAQFVTQRSLQFTYELRPDQVPTYVGGSLVKGMKRLTTIQTYAPFSPTSGSVLVREYRLSYEIGIATNRSRIALM